MNIVEQLNEYKARIESLASLAGLSEELKTKVSELETEKQGLEASLSEKEALASALTEKVSQLETELTALKADIEKREAEKKASDAKALEIVASLGLKEIPVIKITETDKPTAESIRAKYMAITDPTEKGKFFSENRKAILDGVVE
jgi:predicted nuclease with TOPRIM domain